MTTKSPDVEIVAVPAEKSLQEHPDEPPVIARMIIEIRSDGSRTIARGAMQDPTTGREVAVKAEGTTPLALAAQLARSMFQLPFLLRPTGTGDAKSESFGSRLARAFLPRAKK